MFTSRWLPRPAPYQQTWDAMRDFTASRTELTPDQIWLVEHDPVYTLGQAGKAEHILNSAGIPVVSCDRGGQVTYHGPGQVVAYCLINLRRYRLYIKEYVVLLETVLIDFLHHLGLTGARTVSGAPGVYVPVTSIVRHPLPDAAPDATSDPFSGLAKISALGIKVHRGCTYHGLALNVDMDLAPFSGINPCGYPGVPTTDLRSCGVSLTVQQVGDMLAVRLKDAIINYGQHQGDLQT